MHLISQNEIDRQKVYIEQVLDCQEEYRQSTGFTRRYYLTTYGCQLNENDSEQLVGQLNEMGYIAAGDMREADLLIFNTCSVRENADDRLFGNLGIAKNIRRDKPDLVVAVCGCMMKQKEHVERIMRSYPFVNIVFGPQDIYRLPELLYTYLSERRRVFEVGDQDAVAEGLPIHRARKFRALVSIMFGCNNFCTYCIVPYTRGRERSRLAPEILREINQVAEEGYKEIMLLGQNVNSYGNDLAPADKEGQPQNFADLLAKVAMIPGLRRIRFMTSHPKDISLNLLEVIGRHENIEPHLHLPLQSGSDRILKKMNRHYTREQYLNIVQQARKLRPGLVVTTDLIVGFPGESEEDFAATLDLMEKVRFDSAFTYQYSKRTGTLAAEMEEQVPTQVVKQRFERLLSLQNKHSLASNQALLGQTVEILIEGSSGTQKSVLSGRTASGKLVNFTLPADIGLPAEALTLDGDPDGTILKAFWQWLR